MKEEVIGTDVFRRTPTRGDLAILSDSLGNGCNDVLCNLLLDGKHVFNCAVISFSPKMTPVGGIHELRRDPDAVSRPAHAPLNHVSGTERAANIAHVHGFPAKRECGVACDHREFAETGELGDHILRHAVTEIDLLGIAAHVLEWQNRNRRLVGTEARRQRGRRAGKDHPVSSDGARDVLQPLLTRILETDIEFAREMVVRGARDQYASWRAQLLQTGRDVDPVTQEIIALDHDIAKVDTDAQGDSALGSYFFLPAGYLCLHGGSASHRADDRPELCDQAVAHQLDEAAAMLSEQWPQQRVPQILYRGKRPGFIGLDKPRVTDDIGNQYRGQPSFWLRQCHLGTMPLFGAHRRSFRKAAQQ